MNTTANNDSIQRKEKYLIMENEENIDFSNEEKHEINKALALVNKFYK